MRISKLYLDGYSLFTGRELDLAPGLQVIVGPNEQGKSTVRYFIGDMLYGQKRSTTQRRYDESHTLRRPWNTSDCYAGRMVYLLDDGHEVEIHRGFDKKRESIKVFDRTHAREITATFPRLRNREVAFAETHLGLTKAVFLNTATISHMSLEKLSDRDALPQIRQKVLSLADSGEEEHSAEAALKYLEERLVSIGRPTPRSSRPLATAHAQLRELDNEYRQAEALRRGLAEQELKHRTIQEEIHSLRQRRDQLEEALRLVEMSDRQRRLRQTDDLTLQIDEVTKECFSQRAAQNFPLDKVPQVQHIITQVTTARLQVQRTEAELAGKQQQLDTERRRLGPAAARPLAEIPEEWEERLQQLGTKAQRLHDALEAAEAAFQAATADLEKAERDVAALPDFDRLAADPVEWLNQLASPFGASVRARDHEQKKLQGLRADVARLQPETAESQRIFSQFQNFPQEIRDYEVQMRVEQDRIAQLTGRVNSLRLNTQERMSAIPGYKWKAIAGTLGMVLFLLVAYFSRNWGVVIPAALAGIAFLWFLGAMVCAQIGVARTRRYIAETEAEIVGLRNDTDQRRGNMGQIIRDAGCQTVRELEALYEKHRDNRAKLNALQEALADQEAKTREEEQHVSALLDRLRATLRQVGEEVKGDEDVQHASTRAIARYHAYSDAKRRVAEHRDRIQQHQQEIVRVTAELEAARKEELDRSLEVRQIMRENGFRDESKHTSALRALRAYRLRGAQARQKSGRIEVLQENVAALERQLAAEREDLAKHEPKLGSCLSAAGAESIEHWRALHEQAKKYRDARERRTNLEARLKAVLQGEDLRSLRERVDAAGPVQETPSQDLDELRAAIADLSKAVDARVQEGHTLRVSLTERLARVRSLNEIEEERADLERRVRELELEREAASYAMAAIEEIARDKHARIAPRLAALASSYLSEITGGAYQEVLLSRDLGISVRIPQTSQLNEEPERQLSKGTVDQIYLALRLAMVQMLSEGGETVPMLLDDPFANYDDVRLNRALLLLSRIGTTCQILLFTCRDDVARAARTAGAPLLEL